MPNFSVSLNNFSEKTKVKSSVVYRAIVLTAFTEIVKGNPVDTGYSQSAWVIGVGQRSNYKPAGPPSGGAGSVLKNPNAIAALSAISKGSFPVVIISNNVEYVVWLNYGNDKRQPSFFVERGVRNAIQAYTK